MANNDFRLGAKRPWALVMDSQRDDLQRNFSIFEIIQQQPDGAAFERQMARAERTGAFRKYKQLAAGAQLIETLAHCGIIERLIAFILGARDGNAIKEQPREPALAQLRGNHKHRRAQNTVINKTIHRAVPMQAEVKNGPGFRQTFRMHKCDTLKIDGSNETIKPSAPKWNVDGKAWLNVRRRGCRRRSLHRVVRHLGHGLSVRLRA